MEIKALEPTLEPIFWEHVNQDIPHYYFYAFDWKYNKEATEILLALERNRIDGMMLVYRQSIVQLRGSCEAAKALLQRLDLKKVELQALKQHRQHIFRKYKPSVSREMIMMTLHKARKTPQTKYPVVKLDTSEAEKIATIMRDADPDFWGSITGQQIIEGMTNVNWLGIKIDDRLVSIGSARVTEWGGLIGVVATHKNHRNRDLATSIVSELVKQIIEKTSIAMIYVLSNNPSAIRVYKKVGFKPYRRYFFMRGERSPSQFSSDAREKSNSRVA